MNLFDVTQDFSTEEKCIAHIESRRWPDGKVRCITCGNDKISRITRKTPSKNKRCQIYQCLEKTCKQQFSATSGTIFNDTHLPLQKWFMAASIIMDAKKGISAKQLQQHLGIKSYETTWHLNHRIRQAMPELNPAPMTGVVEMDETYIGGHSKRRLQTKQRPKDMVVAIRERSKKGRKDGKYAKDGRVRFFHVPDAKKQTISALVQNNIDQWVDRIYTDMNVVYDFALDIQRAATHRAVNHTIEWVVPGSRIHTNTVESSFSLLKRGLTGSFHRVSTKHLQRYLNEFEYRFNERHSEDRFGGIVTKMCATHPLPYRTLVDTPVEPLF